jgi:hypothetical protein
VKSTTVCRAAATSCDLAESCDGVGNTCPADQIAGDGSSCSDGAFCNGAETCLGGSCQPATPPCSAACDEGTDVCLACPLMPRTDCRTAEKTVVSMKNDLDNTKDRLVWKWIRGASTDHAEFADPRSTGTYSLCLYSGPSSAFMADLTVEPDGLLWKSLGALGDKGFLYKDNLATVRGVQRILVKPSMTAKSKALVKGKGSLLPNLPLPVTPPLKLQLSNSDSGLCWASELGSFTINDGVSLRGVTP